MQSESSSSKQSEPSDLSAAATLLADSFDRVRDVVGRAVSGLTARELAAQPSPTANSIAWLVWHLTRIQDDHLAELAGTEQVWTASGWHERLGLPFEPGDTGFGHSAAQVADVHPESADVLTGYLDEVTERSIGFVRELGDQDYERVVDDAWDPPVTLGVRLISVLSDNLQHAGQAAYVRGLLTR